MKKLMSVIGLMVLMVTLAACSPKKEASGKDDVGVTMRLNKMDMTLDNIVTTNASSDNKDKKMIILEFSLKNTSKTEQPIGANDFKVIDNKKEYEIYGLESDNFGQVLESGKELTGKAYFEVPESLEKATIAFKPENKVLGEWDLTIPDKKQR